MCAVGRGMDSDKDSKSKAARRPPCKGVSLSAFKKTAAGEAVFCQVRPAVQTACREAETGLFPGC